jgi:hypothetical protein
VQISTGRKPVSGELLFRQPVRAAIAEEHVDLWPGIFKGSRMAAKVRRVRRLDPNHIIVDFDPELSGVRDLPRRSQNEGNNVIKTHLKHILEKRNGQWKVLSAQDYFPLGRDSGAIAKITSLSSRAKTAQLQFPSRVKNVQNLVRFAFGPRVARLEPLRSDPSPNSNV